MSYVDEPIAGENLPILPGHVSPGRFESSIRDMVSQSGIWDGRTPWHPHQNHQYGEAHD